MFGVPVTVAAAPVVCSHSVALKLAFLALAPITGAVAFVLVAGLLSRIGRRAIVPGKFPRRLSHAVYGPRRLYGLCWTAVYYAGPIYQLILMLPPLRSLMLWLFGYRGSTDVTFYADTWLRDLPLLDIGRGAYLSNKSTIGTNICLQNGDILVDRITIGDRAMVGHLVMLAPGCIIGADAEVGVGVAFGIKAQLGAKSRIGPSCTINHGARIGDGVEIGTMAYIGVGARIADGLRIPEGAIIPSRAVVTTQLDVEKYAVRSTQQAPSAELKPARTRSRDAIVLVTAEGA